MNIKSIILLLPILLPVLSVTASGVCIFLLLKTRVRLRTAIAALNYADSEVVEISRELEIVSKRSVDLAHRITLLESKRFADATETTTDQVGLATPKLTITERRHRIRVLARKGKNAESIAATLGMPYGEVQLIMGLTANA